VAALLAAVAVGCGDQPDDGPGESSVPVREASRHLISRDELEVLRGQGLTDPVRQIVSSLRSHPEAIPHAGVLGGQMGFYSDTSIHVLNARTVFASFTDGHIEGSGVFEYTIEPDTTITWKVIASRIEGPPVDPEQ
jgi:predicted xylose isomerase-like sugar epimerase